ncbi:MAG: solute carrier family 23 protein [bacterium]
MEKLVLDVHEKPKKLQWLLLSFQHVFAMFGATVLVPMLTGLDIGVALIASGCGTLIYIACTKGKVPVYLGSSFAYIAAICAFGESIGTAFIGLIIVGLIYISVALLIKFVGKDWLEKLFPPLIVGPMIMVIGLSLAGTAVSSAGFDGSGTWQTMVVAVITFFTVVIVSLKGKGMMKLVPFLIGIATGYVSAVILHFTTGQNLMDFSAITNANFFELPKFTFIGTYSITGSGMVSALLLFGPLAFVTICEHIGDHKVLSEVTGKDFINEPGLDKTLMGDGLATLFSGVIGGPANTTYGENTGVVSMTKVASVWVIGGAAIIAILLGFLGYVQGFIQTIPSSIMGAISIILFGMIAANGLKVIGNSKVNLNSSRNIIVIASMLVVGLGGATITLNAANGISVSGMAVAVIVGVVLNLILPKEKEVEIKIEE